MDQTGPRPVGVAGSDTAAGRGVVSLQGELPFGYEIMMGRDVNAADCRNNQ